MDIKELKQKSDKEIATLTQTLRERLRTLRFEVASDSVKNVREIRVARKTIARALTVARERVTAKRS